MGFRRTGQCPDFALPGCRIPDLGGNLNEPDVALCIRELRPEADDNQWFDGIVGCAVAASMENAVLPGTQEVDAPKRERIELSDLRRQSRE